MRRAIRKRIDEANGVQDTLGACVLCGKPFQDCKHLLGEVASALMEWQIAKRARADLLGDNQ